MSAYAPPPEPGRPAASRRRTVSLVLATLLVVGIGAGLVQQLWPEPEPGPQARPLSTAEAHRLADMRRINWEHGRAGVRATIGGADQQVRATGWVDWRRPMVYLALSGRTPGVADTLVQAVPGLVAVRAGASTGPAGPQPQVVDPYPPPPVRPPADGWRVRRTGADGPVTAADSPAAVDALSTLLFAVAAEQPASPDLLVRSESRWLRRDLAAGHRVDVLLGPAAPPTPPAPPASPPPGPRQPDAPSPPDPSLAEMGGAVQYWLDDSARVHRLDALLAAEVPLRVELDRRDRTAPQVLDALGGPAAEPRRPTEEEAQALARLRQRNRASRGGEIRVSLVTEEGQVRAAGWLDWRQPAAYLAVDAPQPADSGLLWADRTGVATRFGQDLAGTPSPAPSPSPASGSGAAGDDGAGGDSAVLLPPAPPPGTGDQWRRQPWEERGDEYGGYDLDLLLNEALSLSGWAQEDASELRERAYWLRNQELGGHPVDVYEMPREIEQDVAPGDARLRYWVGAETGLLHRLEIRTRTGTFAQLDVRGGDLPEAGLVAPPA